MDIGFYCTASAVALWGEPHGVTATASLLESGVDAHGVVVLDYGDFSVTLQHSKVSDSVLPSEIQGEDGSLVIEKNLRMPEAKHRSPRRQSAGADAASAY